MGRFGVDGLGTRGKKSMLGERRDPDGGQQRLNEVFLEK